MTQKYWLSLSPSLLVGVGILVATFIAGLGGPSRWMVMAGLVFMALVIVAADALDARLRGKSAIPSWGGLIIGCALVLAGFIVGTGEPNLIKSLIPMMGVTGWVSLLMRPEGRRRACWGI